MLRTWWSMTDKRAQLTMGLVSLVSGGVGSLIAISLAWGSMSAKVEANAQSIHKHEARLTHDGSLQLIHEIQVRLSAIDEKLTVLHRDLIEVKLELKERRK